MSGPGIVSFLQFSLLGVVIGILVGLLGVVRHGSRHDRMATTRALCRINLVNTPSLQCVLASGYLCDCDAHLNSQVLSSAFLVWFGLF